MNMGTSIDPAAELPNPLDPEEVEQEQIIGPALLVRPDGPVTVHELPARAGPIGYDSCPSTTWTKVLNNDPKRKRATVISDQNIYLSRSQSGNVGGPWPLNVPLVVTHADALYVKAVSTTATVTTVTEIWAD